MNHHLLLVLRRSGVGFAAIAGLILFVASVAGFQFCAAEPPPDPPLVGTAPDPCAWTITVQQKKALQPPPSEPRAAAAFARAAQSVSRILRVEVAKSGGNRREVTYLENGKQSTIYVHNGWVVFQPMTWPADQAMALPINDHASPIKGGIKSDFPDLSWVRPEVYLGRQSRGGTPCYYYEDKKHGPLGGSDTRSPPVTGVRAWIDVQTRLPIAVEDDALSKTYAYRQSGVSAELTGVFAAAYNNSAAASAKKDTPTYGNVPSDTP